MEDQLDLRKARAGYLRLREVEKQLDERIARTPTWSGKWWYVLEQLNIVRGQLIFLRELLKKIAPAREEF